MQFIKKQHAQSFGSSAAGLVLRLFSLSFCLCLRQAWQPSVKTALLSQPAGEICFLLKPAIGGFRVLFSFCGRLFPLQRAICEPRLSAWSVHCWPFAWLYFRLSPPFRLKPPMIFTFTLVAAGGEVLQRAWVNMAGAVAAAMWVQPMAVQVPVATEARLALAEPVAGMPMQV